jgi:CSLREA domain-containing protein/uncharacterized repeat protein (TIGR01451 family)
MVLATAPAATASTFMVDTVADAVDADPGDASCATAAAVCSLRAAVQEANQLQGPDEITLPLGTYPLELAGRGEDAAATGDLDVTDPLTITGAGGRLVTITGRRLDRVFDVVAGSLTLRGLTVGAGRASGAGDDAGGGVRVGPSASLDVSKVRLSGNDAAAGGTEIANAGTTHMSAASVTNAGQTGSAIQSSGTLEMTNDTVWGAAVEIIGGAATILNSTLMGGTHAPTVGLLAAGGATSVTNSIVGSSGGYACSGAALPQSGGHNLASDTTCGLAGTGDIASTDLGFQSGSVDLQVDTAETDVLPIWASGTSFDPPPGVSCDPGLCPRLSRAVDAAGSGACPATDQIATKRPQGAACDIGAFEVPQLDLTLTLAADATSVEVGKPFTLTWTLTNQGPADAANLLLYPRLPLNVTITAQDVARSYDGCIVYSGGMCDLRTGLSAGASLIRTMTVQATSPGQLDFKGYLVRDASYGNEISWNPYEPNQANNTASVAVTAVSPPVVVKQPKPGRCANPRTGATAKPDILVGTAFGDAIAGGLGNDKLSGLAGDDCLTGGGGNDVLDGGSGNDKLSGGPGRDNIVGGTGSDQLTGGPGKDTIDGGAGADVISAADYAKDTINCGKGRDRATVDRIDRVRGCEKVKRKR